MSIQFDPSILTLRPGVTNQTQPKPVSSPGENSKFAAMLAEGISSVNEQVVHADKQVEHMVETQGANIHETMVALEKADIAMRLTVKISQKLVQAYQEVSRMQV